ncbi:MAG: hypothetical protein QG580_112 [Patescibacteria group bacterium]|jgi:hypothetical protein|nr:hypothetical protein [Patescibacteria group bacterium]
MSSKSIFEEKRWTLLRQKQEWFESSVYIVNNVTDVFIAYICELSDKISDFDEQDFILDKDKKLIEKEIFSDIEGKTYDYDVLSNADKYCMNLSRENNFLVVHKIRHAAYNSVISLPMLGSTQNKIYKIFYKGSTVVDLSKTKDILVELEYNNLWNKIKFQNLIYLSQVDDLYKKELDPQLREEKLKVLNSQKNEMFSRYIEEYKAEYNKINS